MASRDFPDSFETTTGVLAATQGTLLTTTHELHEVRAQLEAATAALENLRTALELRDAALDAGSNHFMIVDLLRKGRPIVYANRALAHEHGYEPDQLIGKSVKTLTPDAQDRKVSLKFYADIAAGHTVHAQMQGLRKDGTTFWMDVCTTPLRNPQGVISHYVTVGSDITAERKPEP